MNVFRNVVLVLAIIAGAIRSFLRGMVQTVWFWFASKRKPLPPGVACLAEYPSLVSAYFPAWEGNDGPRLAEEWGLLFFGCSTSEWQAEVCSQIGRHKYRLELWFSRAGEPVLTNRTGADSCFAYPYPVEVYTPEWDKDGLALRSGRLGLFSNSYLGRWLTGVCQKLGGGEYRMELRFHRVKGGE